MIILYLFEAQAGLLLDKAPELLRRTFPKALFLKNLAVLTAEEEKEMSAADKLLARLNKYKATEPAPEQKSGENLIDKFLREDHHLDRNKEVKEGDMGKDSVKQPELYSEKLAKLYIQQGHYDKAIASYEKLNAKYPDKAEYFAAQIEEIKKLMNNNK